MSGDRLEFARRVLADPYPADIFSELSKDEMKRIQVALAEFSSVPYAIERLHASWARHLYANMQHYAQEDSF